MSQTIVRGLQTSGCGCDCPSAKTTCCINCLPYCLKVSIPGWGDGFAYITDIDEETGIFPYWEGYIGGDCATYDQYAKFIRVRIRCVCDADCDIFKDGVKPTGLEDPPIEPNCGFEISLETTFTQQIDGILCTDWHYEQVADTYDSGWVCPEADDQECDPFSLAYEFTGIPVVGTSLVTVTLPEAGENCCNDKGCCTDQLPETLYAHIDFAADSFDAELHAAESNKWTSTGGPWHIDCEGILSATDPGIDIQEVTLCCRGGTWYLEFWNEDTCVFFACARPIAGVCSPLDLEFTGYMTAGTNPDCCTGDIVSPGIFQNWTGSVTE